MIACEECMESEILLMSIRVWLFMFYSYMWRLFTINLVASLTMIYIFIYKWCKFLLLRYSYEIHHQFPSSKKWPAELSFVGMSSTETGKLLWYVKLHHSPNADFFLHTCHSSWASLTLSARCYALSSTWCNTASFHCTNIASLLVNNWFPIQNFISVTYLLK